MKFVCNKTTLSEALNNVSKAVASKSTIVALESIKVCINQDKLQLTGYDLEIGIQTYISVQSKDIEEFIINSKLFTDIIRKMPYDEITIEKDENYNVKIIGGLTEYNITCLPTDEFPSIPEVNNINENGFDISQGKLKNMINQTIFAVSTGDNKPILTGELFDINSNLKIFNMVAIDGFRLAIRTESLDIDNDYKFVVPAKALKEISSLLKDDEDLNCTIFVSTKHIIFDISGYLVISRLLEGEFHNYKGSLPTSNSTEIIINTKQFIDSLERCSLLINDRLKAPVICLFENNELKLSCKTSLGKFYDELTLEMSGASVEIGFNNKYLLDSLKASETDKVKFLINGGLSPMKIVPISGDSFTFLVLPVRLKAD